MGFGRLVSLAAGVEVERGFVGTGVDVDWISPTAVDTLLVKEEMAQPVHEAASLGWGVLIRGAPALVESVAAGGGNTVSAIVLACFLIRWRKRSMVLFAWSRMSFSLSIKLGQMAGNILLATSSSLKESEVAPNAIRAAFLA